MRVKHFINLTNGIDAIPKIRGDYSFIRIQSTICENKAWDRLILDLDNNFLMSLSLGYECHIYDYSNRKDVPRSFYQGLEFIKWILNKRWFNRDFVPRVNNTNCQGYFESVKIDRCAKRKIDYFKKFINTSELKIVTHAGRTTHDGDYGYYAGLLKEVNQ